MATSTTDPSSNTSAVRVLRGLFELRPAPPKRWMFALRAAICMGAPILTGWVLNDTSAGLMASIGGFTSLYGSGRPYLSRAWHLALIAVAFALAVGIGLWVAPSPPAVVVTVALIAMLSTWLSNALQIGPPGAYMFTLACAAATAIPGAHLAPATAALLVLAGGSFAWLMQMGGAVFAPRGPERIAVAAAAKAVVAYIEAIGTPSESRARHQAAFALHNTWSTLVSQQPAQARAGGELSRLRSLNRELHLLFADAIGAATRGERPVATAIDDARAVAARVTDPRERPHDADLVPLGHPSALDALIEALQPGSNSRRVILRVGVAAIVVGVLGATLHFERAYWAVAATVLMLHQGFDWLRMIQRSIERLLGTWIGLLLAGAILALHPQGPWLALIVMVLQFTIEMLVLRNYALAAIFITGAALTIASGGHSIEDPAPYLLARGLDTFAGCLAALVVFRFVPPRAAALRIPAQLTQTLRTVAAVVPCLASGEVTNDTARAKRRDVQRASFALTHAYDDGIAGSSGERRSAESLWPAIAAVERLAYRTLSACWALERLGGQAAREAAVSMFANDGAVRAQQAIQALIESIRSGTAPGPLPPVPHVLEAELDQIRECLTRDALAR